MKKFSLFFVLVVIASLLLTACGSEPTEPVVEPTPSESPALIAEGRLLPVNSMNQFFSGPGQVAEVLVKDGENVIAGQVLARLHSSPNAELALARAEEEVLAAQQGLETLESNAQVSLAQANLDVLAAQEQRDAAQEQYDAEATEQTKADLEAAEAILQQAEQAQAQLEANAGIDPDQMAAAQARLVTAQAALASAQAAIDALELKATIDGTVVDLTLQAGDWVTAGQPVITLADYSAWIVKTDNLTELEVTGVQVGQSVKVILDAMPEKTLSGEISQINSRFEEKRGEITYTATILLSQPDPAMLWGMTAVVEFTQ